MTREPRPRIYAASLSDYNAGRLHGVWIDAAQSVRDLEAEIQRMLATSPLPGAEEFAIFDYEDFGPLRLSEYESIEVVSRLASGIARHGMAFAHWAHLTQGSWDDSLDRFLDCYFGHWDTFTDFANIYIQAFDVSLYPCIPSTIARYVRFDVEALARDLVSIHLIVEAGDGIYVFDP